MKTYKVLYTHQKNKKSKVWQDGTLKEINNTKLSLSADNGRYIESVFTLSDNIGVGDEIESDGHLILIDALNDEKENVLPTTSTTQPTKQSPPVRPKFVSKKFTPPTMRTRSVLPDSQQSSNPVLISISQPRLLSQYQSRKVVRKSPCLVTSLSNTFQSTEESSNDYTQFTSRCLPSSSPTISTRSVSDLSLFLEPPTNLATNANFPNRPSFSLPGSQNQTSTIGDDEPDEVLSSQKDTISDNILMDSTKLNTLQSDSWSFNSQCGTPTEVRSIDSIFKALNGQSSTPPSSKEGADMSFDLIDDSLFSPSSPPQPNTVITSGTSSQNQTESNSVTSSLERLIENKIEVITAPSNNPYSAQENTSTNYQSSLFETVDYFDIIGDDDDDDTSKETFNPTVIDFATQKELSVHEKQNVISTGYDQEITNHVKTPTSNTSTLTPYEPEVNHLLSPPSKDCIDENPSCSAASVWDFGETSYLQIEPKNDVFERKSKTEPQNGVFDKNSKTEPHNDVFESNSKRRKLGDTFRKPSSNVGEPGNKIRKGFTTPFVSGENQLSYQPQKNEFKFAMEPQKREQEIPVLFTSAVQYRNTMLDVVYEHVNVSLSKICEKYSRFKPCRDSTSQSVRCAHGVGKVCTVAKDGANKGRQFYTCSKKECDLFQWVEGAIIPKNSQEAFNYFSRHGLSFYTNCQLKRKTSSNLYLLQLPVQDKHAAYNKDDLWILNPGSVQPSIMASTFFGPSSGGYVEMRLLNSSHPACGVTVNALQALRAVSELEIISALDKVNTLPLIPSLLTKQTEAPSNGTVKLLDNTEEICMSMCQEYQLNEKQEEAAIAFINSLNQGCPILCVHGVFGSGKSYLLAVLVLILVKVLDGTHHRILITSTTNVAVDNILLKLLDLGFEHFVRVGSVKRTHKKIAPHVVQNQESSNSAQARQDIQKRYQVVGTTCASSPGVSDHDIVLFDEVSQITEPSSLLPLIHSKCKYLMLVGDPQQLPPTVETQHVKGEGAPGLEQTLFDRLVKMGYPTVLLKCPYIQLDFDHPEEANHPDSQLSLQSTDIANYYQHFPHTQYRCPPAISIIPNTLFYSGELQDGHVTGISPLSIPPLTFVSVPGSESNYGDSYSNAAEVKAISELVNLMTSQKKVSKEDIAVITLYRGQESLLKKELASSKSLKISTVDAVQGAEKPITILSCVRTTRIGFADCPRRVNVAITRAKQHLIILGNIQMLSTNQLWGTIIQMCADRGVVLTLSDVINQLAE